MCGYIHINILIFHICIYAMTMTVLLLCNSHSIHVASDCTLLTSSGADPLIGLRALWGGEADSELGRLPSEGATRDGANKAASSSNGAMPCRELSSSPRHSCSICRSITEIKAKRMHFSLRQLFTPTTVRKQRRAKMFSLESAATIETTHFIRGERRCLFSPPAR